MFVNLVFHSIAPSSETIESVFAVTTDFFSVLIHSVEDAALRGLAKFDNFRIYFDDGYESSLLTITKQAWLNPALCTIGIITDKVGTDGYLNWKQIIELRHRGVNIASHGTSHAALAIYEGEILKSTPNGGLYQNSPIGRTKALAMEEVRYQYQESKKILEEKIGAINEFIFPYGLYNKEAIKLNAEQAYYSTLSTCDSYLDQGDMIRPRFIITNDLAPLETMEKILGIKTISTP